MCKVKSISSTCEFSRVLYLWSGCSARVAGSLCIYSFGIKRSTDLKKSRHQQNKVNDRKMVFNFENAVEGKTFQELMVEIMALSFHKKKTILVNMVLSPKCIRVLTFLAPAAPLPTFYKSLVLIQTVFVSLWRNLSIVTKNCQYEK